ncbi:MAG: adenylosuccinate synthase [Planctomycetota bacterium]
MPSLSVFGAQWGDEGKGKIIDLLSDRVDVVVRYQGGANAGHTVVVDGEKWVLHLIPSGILHPGKVNVIAAGVAIDPVTLLGEIDGLRARGVDVGPDRLRIAANAHVIFEQHKRIDGLSERWRGDGRIGTTGRGIGPAYADKAARTGLRICDLLEPERCSERLRANLAEKNALVQLVHEEPPLPTDELVDRYIALGERLRPYVGDTGAEIRRAWRDDARILFEGAQGVLLDIDHGTYPFVTSSNTGPGGIPAGAGVPPQAIGRSIGIAKAYCTRVGEGPFPSELHGDAAKRLRDAGHEYGTTTGRPRRAGRFDAVAARYGLELAGAEGWIMTKLDVLTGLGDLEVVVGYVKDGERYADYPAHLPTIEGIEVETETLAGWDEDVAGARSYDDLPPAARAYVERVEELVGTPISMLSVGAERDAVIVRSPILGEDWSVDAPAREGALS